MEHKVIIQAPPGPKDNPRGMRNRAARRLLVQRDAGKNGQMGRGRLHGKPAGDRLALGRVRKIRDVA